MNLLRRRVPAGASESGQKPSVVLMIKPVAFAPNIQTAPSNRFQKIPTPEEDYPTLALAEQELVVQALESVGIRVILVNDKPYPVTPDAIFPNNWILTEDSGCITIFPMFAENRRLEIRKDIITSLRLSHFVAQVDDLSMYVHVEKFLEGTGSMVLDRGNKICYASVSVRTNPELLQKWCSDHGYELVSFTSFDREVNQIYHTNVMMSVGTKFAIVCLRAIHSDTERAQVVARLTSSGKEIIEIDYHQLYSFGGNVLELTTADGKKVLVISKTAHGSLDLVQRSLLEKYIEFLVVDIPTIERIGGGGIRCILAEIVLPTLD